MDSDDTKKAEDNEIFRPHGSYLVYAVAAGAVVLLLTWSLLQTFDLPTLVMLLIAIGVGGWSLLRYMTRVAIGSKALVVHAPLRRAQEVEFRQLAAVHEEGRLLKALVVLYRPLRADGLVDADGLLGLTLPALGDQARLLTLLDAAAPGLERSR